MESMRKVVSQSRQPSVSLAILFLGICGHGKRFLEMMIVAGRAVSGAAGGSYELFLDLHDGAHVGHERKIHAIF
jgi:hypothetical protein